MSNPITQALYTLMGETVIDGDAFTVTPTRYPTLAAFDADTAVPNSWAAAFYRPGQVAPSYYLPDIGLEPNGSPWGISPPPNAPLMGNPPPANADFNRGAVGQELVFVGVSNCPDARNNLNNSVGGVPLVNPAKTPVLLWCVRVGLSKGGVFAPGTSFADPAPANPPTTEPGLVNHVVLAIGAQAFALAAMLDAGAPFQTAVGFSVTPVLLGAPHVPAAQTRYLDAWLDTEQERWRAEGILVP